MRGFLGAPSAEEVPFDWKFINYAPIVLAIIFIALWIGWHVSAKNWFTGPKHTIDLPEGSRRPTRSPSSTTTRVT